MAIDPRQIELTPAQRQQIADLAERRGKTPGDVLDELLAPASVLGHNGDDDTVGESAHDLGKRLGLYAALESGPSDLSSNRKYMEGFGTGADRPSTHACGSVVAYFNKRDQYNAACAAALENITPLLFTSCRC